MVPSRVAITCDRKNGPTQKKSRRSRRAVLRLHCGSVCSTMHTATQRQQRNHAIPSGCSSSHLPPAKLDMVRGKTWVGILCTDLQWSLVLTVQARTANLAVVAHIASSASTLKSAMGADTRCIISAGRRRTHLTVARLTDVAISTITSVLPHKVDACAMVRARTRGTLIHTHVSVCDAIYTYTVVSSRIAITCGRRNDGTNTEQMIADKIMCMHLRLCTRICYSCNRKTTQ